MKLNLRLAEEQDFESVWMYCSNHEITKFLTWEHYKSKDECRKFFEEKMLKFTEAPNIFLVITLNNSVIGTAHIIGRTDKVLQVGYGVLPEYWNKGYGNRILGMLERYIITNFDHKDYVIRADIHEDNIAMKKILNKYGYELCKKIERNRISFESNLVRDRENISLIEWLKALDMIDCVMELGSLRKEEYSDTDLLIAVYEEKKIGEIVRMLKDSSSFFIIDNPCSNHIFVSDKMNRIFDIYIASTACINAFHNIKKCIFDKSGFISKLLELESELDFLFLVKRSVFHIKKVLDKLSSKKYVQATRMLGDIRDKVIIPLGNYMGILEASDIINMVWKDETSPLYDVYMSTFVPPKKENLKLASIKLIEFIEVIIKNNNLYELSKECEGMKQYVDKL